MGLYGIAEVILGIILVSYVGMVINHDKFPYWPTSAMESGSFFFFRGSNDAVKIQVYGWLWFYPPWFFLKHIYIYIYISRHPQTWPCHSLSRRHLFSQTIILGLLVFSGVPCISRVWVHVFSFSKGPSLLAFQPVVFGVWVFKEGRRLQISCHWQY